MGWSNASIHLDLSEPRFFANLRNEGESRKLVFQARLSEGLFLIPSRFESPGLAPWSSYDYGLKYIEEGPVHIWEGPSERGHHGSITYIPPFERESHGFELQIWVSRETFQLLMDVYPNQMDCQLDFTFAPKGQGVVESYYDEFTKNSLTAWDTEAENQIFSDQVTIQVIGRAPLVNNDHSEEERMTNEVAIGLLPTHAEYTELVSKVAEIKKIGSWVVALMCAILVVLLFSRK